MHSWIEQQRARRAEAYPTEERALAYMHDGYARLCDLGWRQPCYFVGNPQSRIILSTVIGSPLVHNADMPRPGYTLWRFGTHEDEASARNAAFVAARRFGADAERAAKRLLEGGDR